ncbi:fungal protease inhibitor-1-like [Aricia agestis]|uniref:fungal protease inhibitor-1-like n=1 Tax=Aricia agestis TaxID=91739 RepID=UPI001C20356A|nr:fungal protease inhibitor-1-like [Aricia agestis]
MKPHIFARNFTSAAFTVLTPVLLAVYYSTSTMRAVLVLAVLACAVALVYGDFVCGRSYCKDHPCDKPIASSSCRSPSLYRANHAGKCACCPACVTLLSEGQACKKYSKELGETPSAVCREPLKCLKGVCTNVPPRK